MTIRERLENLRPLAWLIEDLEQEREWAKATLTIFPEQQKKWEDMHQASIDELKSQRQATLDLIDRLDDLLQRDILLARYQDGMKWKDLAGRLFLSHATAHRLHRQAIEELEALDDENQTR